MTEREIFLAAIEIVDPAERTRWVEQACGADVGLRTQVVALLEAHAKTSEFLETPATALDASVSPTIMRKPDETDDDSVDAPSSGEAEFRRYLQPSTRPGWLGRLAHYEIETILGRGAFGIVAKAFDEKLHRVVAIKLMNPELAATSPPRKRFLREARTAAAVSHENIVAIYAVEEEPIPYLVMEYVPGKTLQQRMDEHGPLDVPDILRIGRQIASGLAAAHTSKLIHRDIKPSNILLTDGPTERAKISDFGLARAVDDASLTSSGLIAGTPMYMAPEQARGEPLDHRADLFSLGSVLYQMASGRPPFRAANTVAVLKRVCEDRPRPIDDVLPGIPGWLEAIIFKLLEKDREDRFQTAREVAELLQQCALDQQANRTIHLPGNFAAPIPTTLQTPAYSERSTATAESIPTPRPWITRRYKLPLVVLAAVGLTVGLLEITGVSQLRSRWPALSKPQLPQPPATDEATAEFAPAQPVTIESTAGPPPGSPQGVDLLRHPVVLPFTQAAKGLRFEGDGLIFNSAETDGVAQLWIDDLKVRRGRIRAVFQARGPLPQGVVSVGWDYAGGNPRRYDSVLHAPQGEPTASVWQFGSGFEVTPLVDQLVEVDLSKPVVIEHELSEGEIHATIAGRTVTTKSAAGEDRRAFPFLAVKGLWKLIEWRMWDLDATPPPPPMVVPQPRPAPSTSWHGWPADAPQPAIAPFDAAQAKKHQEEWAAYLKVPVEYTNSIGMKFRLIPPGEFVMGGTPNELKAALDDIPPDDTTWQGYIKSGAPQHVVILTQPIYVGVNEVKQAEYQQVMGRNPSYFAPVGEGHEAMAGMETTSHPVETVTWNDAAEFCAKLSQLEQFKPFYVREGDTITIVEGTGYRLPSEAEWEFANRAGTVTRYWCGDFDQDLLQTAWFAGNASGQTHAVGLLSENPFGLFDTHGNVWEWVQDSWAPEYYGHFVGVPATNPYGPSPADSLRVIRGGGWSVAESAAQSSNRNAFQSTWHARIIGFRASLTIDAVREAIRRLAEATRSKNSIPSVEGSVRTPQLDHRGIDTQTRWSAPINLGPGVNSAVRETNPTLTSDQLLIVFTRAGELYEARRSRRDEPFGAAQKLRLSFDTVSANTSGSISGDGLLLAFNSTALGDKQEDVMLSSRPSRDEPFGTPVRLPQPINSDGADRHPTLSPDGLQLAITTTRKGIKAGSVLIFRRDHREADFNHTPWVDRQLQVAWDSVSSFAADGSGVLKSSMSENIERVTWHARSQPDGPFSSGIPLGPELDHANWGGAFLTADGETLYFHSRGLAGGQGDVDLWMSRRVRP